MPQASFAFFYFSKFYSIRLDVYFDALIKEKKKHLPNLCAKRPIIFQFLFSLNQNSRIRVKFVNHS